MPIRDKDNLVEQLEDLVGRCYGRLWELIASNQYDQAGQLVDILSRLGVI